MNSKSHWQNIYTQKDSTQLSWFQEHAEMSLHVIKKNVHDKNAQLIDIGAGASTLVDDLLQSGYRNIDVLDISSEALQISQQRIETLQTDAKINWIQSNILEADFPHHHYDMWHDRAVFHFLTRQQDRQQYIQKLMHALKPNGKVIISTFGPDGPLECSGLPIVRYSHNSLHNEFGLAFELLEHGEEEHQTPSGSIQKFIYCYCKLNNNDKKH
jgi:2-polyprenyl-3-methyl-5-hydroxy-6-metoxy-1,4-benzoquinol methylase